MQSPPFNPLDRNHIQVAPSQKEKRQQRFYRTYPWYFATIWAVVVSGFFWSEVFHPEPPLPPIPPCVPEGSHRYVTPPEHIRPLIEPISETEPPALIEYTRPIAYNSHISHKIEASDKDPFMPRGYDWDDIPDEIGDKEVSSQGDKLIPGCILIVEEEPRPINMPALHRAINYPLEMRESGIAGTTVIRVLVDEEGMYVKHMVIKQDHPLMTEEIEKHLPILRFEPATQAGKPIPFWVNIPFNISPIR